VGVNPVFLLGEVTLARHLYIAGIDRWDDLIKDSLQIEAVLTYQIDSAQFMVRGPQPSEGDEVIIEDDALGRLFAGIIVKVELADTSPDRTEKVWDVDVDDYTVMLDRRLVVETYQNMTADAIVRDILAKYCPGFTSNHVNTGAPVIETTGGEFNYKHPSECFKWLCEYTGWQWYVDYNKDVWFFNPSELAQPAPMSLEPGGYFRNLKHTIETTGLRNRVYVRGGTMLSDSWTYEVKADGSARAWVLPHKPHEISMTVGGSLVTVGIENVHDEADYDYMMNFQEKYVRCSTQTTTPAAGTTLAFTYKYDIDVITMVEDIASQQAIAAVQGGDGVYEHVIVDDSLTTIDAAEAAGNADLREHANPRVKGSFETEFYLAGNMLYPSDTLYPSNTLYPTEVIRWAPGQLVTINLPDRGIQGTFLVQKVTITPCTPEKWTCRVEYGGRLLGIADYLQALWKAQQKKKLNETTILHKFTYGQEKVQVADEIHITPRKLPYYAREGPVFNRDSVAYKQNGTQVAADQPRFESGKFDQAIMLEEGTENIVLYSEQLDNANWTKIRCSITADAINAPNGTMTADKIVEDTQTGPHHVNQAFTTPADNEIWTGSCYAKAGERKIITLSIRLRDADASYANAKFNLETGEIVSVDSGYTATIKPVTNGFYRCSISGSVGAGTYDARLHVFIYDNDGNSSYTGDGSSGVYVWGLQFEKESYPTGYMATQAGTATRQYELFTIPAEGILNPQEGTIDIFVYVESVIRSQVYGRVWHISDGDKALALVHHQANGQWYIYANDGTNSKNSCYVSDSETPAGWHMFTVTWNGSTVKLYIDGELKGTDTTYIPSTFALLTIGNISGGGRALNTLYDDFRCSSTGRSGDEIEAYAGSGQPLPVDEWTTYKMDMDGILQDIVTTPVCGFVECAGFFQIVAADGLGILTGYEGPAF